MAGLICIKGAAVLAVALALAVSAGAPVTVVPAVYGGTYMKNT